MYKKDVKKLKNQKVIKFFLRALIAGIAIGIACKMALSEPCLPVLLIDVPAMLVCASFTLITPGLFSEEKNVGRRTTCPLRDYLFSTVIGSVLTLADHFQKKRPEGEQKRRQSRKKEARKLKDRKLLIFHLGLAMIIASIVWGIASYYYVEEWAWADGVHALMILDEPIDPAEPRERVTVHVVGVAAYASYPLLASSRHAHHFPIYQLYHLLGVFGSYSLTILPSILHRGGHFDFARYSIRNPGLPLREKDF